MEDDGFGVICLRLSLSATKQEIVWGFLRRKVLLVHGEKDGFDSVRHGGEQRLQRVAHLSGDALQRVDDGRFVLFG